jgi:copper(I)-binding protein
MRLKPGSAFKEPMEAIYVRNAPDQIKDTNMIKRVLLLASVALFAAPQAQAQSYSLAKIKIEHPWARPTPKGARTGAVYLSLENTGSEADSLVSANSPAAGKTQVHKTTNEGGVMKMRPAEGVELAPGATVEFKPGGYHIMLLDLRQTLAEGQTVPLTLTFAKAGTIQIDVRVEKSSDESGSGMMHGQGMDHGMH